MDVALALNTERAIVSRSKYEKEVLPRIEEIYKWLCEGMTEYSIAEQLGISHTTLIEYKKNNAEMIEVYTRARTERNSLVMNKMFSKACGEKVKVNQEKLDKFGNVVVLESELYTPPDVNAADLYLRNNSDEYKSAKADTGGLTLIQNNYQLPELQAQMQALDDKLRELDAIETTAVEAE
jgi:hypothetical protein